MKQNNNQTNITHLRPQPVVIPQCDHIISRDQISENALKVLYRLKSGGYSAYLVGGSVRDMLLGREPKDFDVVTDALPEQIRELFRNSRLIGRRFRLAHVRYGGEVIEVSTFRAHHNSDTSEGNSVEGRIIRDNVYGTIGEDVWRRDLTVNALYYNIEDHTVVDYVSGMADIKSGQIRLIGDPTQRYTEDPVRMLRAVRFAVKLGFRIDPASETPIRKINGLLSDIPSARLFEECLKLFLGGDALQSFESLRHYDLFRFLFPQTDEVLSQQEGGFPQTMVIHALRDTDNRIANDKPVTPGFLIAAFLWMPMINLAKQYKQNGVPHNEAIILASDVVISKQVSCTAMPRRFTQMARDIWHIQSRLEKTRGNWPQRLLSHPKIRAAYDFLLLRNKSGENVDELASWWTDFINRPETVKLLAKNHKTGRNTQRNRHHRKQKPVQK